MYNRAGFTARARALSLSLSLSLSPLSLLSLSSPPRLTCASAWSSFPTASVGNHTVMPCRITAGVLGMVRTTRRVFSPLPMVT